MIKTINKKKKLLMVYQKYLQNKKIMFKFVKI